MFSSALTCSAGSSQQRLQPTISFATPQAQVTLQMQKKQLTALQRAQSQRQTSETPTWMLVVDILLINHGARQCC
jgi:hypothetical protein